MVQKLVFQVDECRPEDVGDDDVEGVRDLPDWGRREGDSVLEPVGLQVRARRTQCIFVDIEAQDRVGPEPCGGHRQYRRATTHIQYARRRGVGEVTVQKLAGEAGGFVSPDAEGHPRVQNQGDLAVRGLEGLPGGTHGDPIRHLDDLEELLPSCLPGGIIEPFDRLHGPVEFGRGLLQVVEFGSQLELGIGARTLDVGDDPAVQRCGDLRVAIYRRAIGGVVDDLGPLGELRAYQQIGQ